MATFYFCLGFSILIYVMSVFAIKMTHIYTPEAIAHPSPLAQLLPFGPLVMITIQSVVEGLFVFYLLFKFIYAPWYIILLAYSGFSFIAANITAVCRTLYLLCQKVNPFRIYTMTGAWIYENTESSPLQIATSGNLSYESIWFYIGAKNKEYEMGHWSEPSEPVDDNPFKGDSHIPERKIKK